MKNPLYGKRILITRPLEQSEEWAEELEKEGSEPIIFPLIEISEVQDKNKLHSVFENLPYYDGIIFTSTNGVRFFFNLLNELDTTDDKISGFDAGADDYLVKPFEFRELVARVKALIKRGELHGIIGSVLRAADLELYPESKLVRRGNKKIDLTTKEFALLELLMRNKGRVVSKATIAEKIWDLTFETGTNVIEVYVNFLRKKIDKDFTPKLIHTQIGMGYVLKEEE